MSRIVLITGGISGIGAATAKAFQKAGYAVAVNYAHHEQKARKFHQETGIPIYQWDVTDIYACINGVRKIITELGVPDTLVNNAGITRDHVLEKMSLEDWRDVIETDLNACFYMCRSLLSTMKESGYGRIINISSVNGLSGQFGQTNYAAAKAGVIGFTKSLALEVASKGITVNAVAPGYTSTQMMDDIPTHILENIIEKIPVGRLAKPEDIARAILFLADREAGYITGETLNVNGGLYMQ